MLAPIPHRYAPSLSLRGYCLLHMRLDLRPGFLAAPSKHEQSIMKMEDIVDAQLVETLKKRLL